MSNDPRQFRILDLFAVLTLAALLCATAAPFVRELNFATRSRLLAVFSCQLLVMLVTIVYSANKRSSLLQRSGNRLGIGYSGAMKWRYGPLFISIMCMLSLATLQLAMSLAFALQPTMELWPPNFVISQVQLGCFTGVAVSRFKWGVYPGAVEFFDNGIAVGGVRFVCWEQVEVRRSHHLPDRLVIFLRQAAGSAAGGTTTVQVSPALCERLVAAGVTLL